jgi:hypothetical protein
VFDDDILMRVLGEERSKGRMSKLYNEEPYEDFCLLGYIAVKSVIREPPNPSEVL